MSRHSKLAKVDFSRIGLPKEARPELQSKIFTRRLARVRQLMSIRGLDALVVYGDREHYGNISWLTNYDPRFEETLLIIFPRETPILLVGNEGMVYSKIARLKVQRLLYQTFSLLGQPRDKVRPLADLLKDTGLGKCSHVGAVGWKYFSEAEINNSNEIIDLPYFIAVSLRAAIKKGGRLTNQAALFMDPETGLRNLLEPEQIADFEWIATYNSEGLLQGIRSLAPGMTEMDAFAKMRCVGMPWCCSPVVSTGSRLRKWSMGSPTSHKIKLGEPILMTSSYQGANTCRFGWVAHGPTDLPVKSQDYVAQCAAPYFESLAAWYETLRIGVQGDDLHHVVWDRLTPKGFSLGLNIGHQIAADEWTHSMVSDGSTQTVRSGMYWQSDFFPSAANSSYVGAFAEDGVVVADKKLRSVLRIRYPAMWKRFEARRRFMKEQLCIAIAEDLLPMSNFCAAVTPFFLAPDLCMVMKGES